MPPPAQTPAVPLPVPQPAIAGLSVTVTEGPTRPTRTPPVADAQPAAVPLQWLAMAQPAAKAATKAQPAPEAKRADAVDPATAPAAEDTSAPLPAVTAPSPALPAVSPVGAATPAAPDSPPVPTPDPAAEASEAAQALSPAAPAPHRAEAAAQPTARPDAPAPSPQAQIAEVVASGTSGTVELRLSPDELGQVRIDMRRDGDTLVVSVSAERQDTLDLLRRNADQLVQDLRASGQAGVSLSFGRWGGQGSGGWEGQAAAMAARSEAAAPDPALAPQAFVRPGVPSSGLYLRI